MNDIQRTAFAQDLLKVLQKHGFKGTAGFFMDRFDQPNIFTVIEPGEKPAIYDLFADAINGLIEGISGVKAQTHGEGIFKPLNPDTDDMPF